jgi:hypothetical protein
MPLAVANQVGPAHSAQRIAKQRPVVRVVPAQEGLVQAAVALEPERQVGHVLIAGAGMSGDIASRFRSA